MNLPPLCKQHIYLHSNHRRQHAIDIHFFDDFPVGFWAWRCYSLGLDISHLQIHILQHGPGGNATILRCFSYHEVGPSLKRYFIKVLDSVNIFYSFAFKALLLMFENVILIQETFICKSIFSRSKLKTNRPNIFHPRGLVFLGNQVLLLEETWTKKLTAFINVLVECQTACKIEGKKLHGVWKKAVGPDVSSTYRIALPFLEQFCLEIQ